MSLSEMTKQRIERTCSRLDKVKDEHFKINSWYESYGNIPKSIDENRCLLDEGFCGSTACVLGTAALIKDFNKLGLFVRFSHYSNYHEIIYQDPDDGSVFSGAMAGSKFFGIPFRHADLLFYTFDDVACMRFYGLDRDDEAESITPAMVAVKLREYIATDGKNVEDFLDDYEMDEEEEEEEEEEFSEFDDDNGGDVD